MSQFEGRLVESASQSDFLTSSQKEKIPDHDTNAQVAGVWQTAPSQSAESS